MEIPRFRKVVNTVEYKTQALQSLNHRKCTEFTWENTNKLLGEGDGGFIGCKTGITNPAGPCFCGGYEKDNHKFIVVVLCSKSMEQRWVEVPKMVEWAIKKKEIA
jgi:serine-type D-Ala-D-Ala carboxypeptidase (penicillin-binding protein 5/6)